MKLIAALIASVALLPFATADVTLLDNQETVIVDCATDPIVNILGNQATVTLTGTCAKVTISGNHATVTGSAKTVILTGNHNTASLHGVDLLTTPGNHNTATWKKPLDAKLKKPKIANPGNHNTIRQTK